MTGPDPDAFAALLCDWSLRVGEGDQVLVRTTTLAQPLVVALHRAILERGGWPLLRMDPPGLEASFLALAREHHLDTVPSLAAAEPAHADCMLRIEAPANTRALAGLDPGRTARRLRATAPLREAMMGTRWCVTLWPTPAQAQEASMGEADFAAFVRRALLLDTDDAVAAWGALSARQAALVERLRGAREIRIEAEGTDLRLDVGGRTWINSDGRRNMPSGEVFTGPREDSAEGTVRFALPSFKYGREVSGVELTFRAGEVVAARAERGEDELNAALGADAGARRLGELGIGTNYGIDRAVGSTLLDEKIGGTVHLALGRSYAETGGLNESAVHWDLVCDLRAGGRLWADGEVVQEDGVFR